MTSAGSINRCIPVCYSKYVEKKRKWLSAFDGLETLSRGCNYIQTSISHICRLMKVTRTEYGLERITLCPPSSLVFSPSFTEMHATDYKKSLCSCNSVPVLSNFKNHSAEKWVWKVNYPLTTNSGPICLQGPHHVAVKSTTTSLSPASFRRALNSS